jgi:hypothetical protein
MPVRSPPRSDRPGAAFISACSRAAWASSIIGYWSPIAIGPFPGSVADPNVALELAESGSLC